MSASEPLDRLTVAGCSGAGKTTLAKALLIRRGASRAAIFDVEDEYESAVSQTARTRSELHEIFSEIEDDPDKWSAFRVRYAPALPPVEEDEKDDALTRYYSKECGWFLQWCMALGDPENPIVALVDEAHESLAQNFASGHSVRFAKKARKRGGFLWTFSQRPREVTSPIRAETSSQELWMLRVREDNDIQHLRGLFGKDFAERVKSLENFHALRIGQESLEPELWYIDGRGAVPEISRIE